MEIVMLNEKIKICCEILEKAGPKDIIILSHADHDGFTANCLIDLFYFDSYKSLIKKFHPSKTSSYIEILRKIYHLKPKYFLIIDALVKSYEKFIRKIISQGSTVVNLDHHDLLSVKHENYLDLNPHNWNIEFMNSSGLCWLIVREFDKKYFDERCWVAGIGAIQDYCIKDNKKLMRELMKRDFLREITLNSALDSKLLEIAKTINPALNLYSVDIVYRILFKAAYSNNIEELRKNEKFEKAFKAYKKSFEEIKKRIGIRRKIAKIRDMEIKFYDLEGNSISLISDICETERERSIYVGYSNGILGFRSLFYDYDVRRLARLFGGGGPHPKVGGARTQDSFNDVIKKVVACLEKETSQKMLDEFV